jgi:hypothetical protein
MLEQVLLVNGWEIRSRDDHGYRVYDSHGLVAGPYGTEEEAMDAAILLPKHPADLNEAAGPSDDKFTPVVRE